MRRTLKILGIAGISLIGVAILTSAALYFFVDLDSLVEREIAKLEPELEEQLGRGLEIGRVRTRFFPTLGARISQLSVAAAEEGQEPLLHIREAGFDLNLLRTLLSLGSSLEVGTIFVDGLEVNVERDAAGRLSFQDILDRQQSAASAPSASAPAPQPQRQRAPEEERDLGWLEAVSIGEIRLRDASVELVDHMTESGEPVHSAIRKIGLRVRDVRLSDPLRIEAAAAIFAEEENFSFQVRVGPLPRDLDFDRLVDLRNIQLAIDQVNLGPIAPYLSGSPLRLEETVVSARYDIPHLASASPLDVQGFLDVRRIGFEGGDPFDLRIDTRFKADPLNFSAQIEELSLGLAGMEVAMEGALYELDTAPRFEGFSLRTSSLDPARIFAIYPALLEQLPPGARIAGPASIELTASGDGEVQELRGGVDLGGLEIFLPGLFAKPAATPLGLRLDGQIQEERLLLRELSLHLADLSMEIEGEVEGFEAPTLDLRLRSEPFTFDRLVRLAPSVAAELREAEARAEGRGQIQGRFAGSAERVDGELKLELLGARLDVPQARVHGDLRMEAAAKGALDGALDFRFLLDAGTSEIRIDELMNKAPGTPLVVDLEGKRREASFEFDRFDVRLAELKMRANGSIGAGSEGRLAMRLEPLDLEALSRTFPIIPADRVKGGRVEAAVSLHGDPGALSTVSAEVERFVLQLGASDLHATASIRNLEEPVIEATLRSRLLDLDELMGDRVEGEDPAEVEPREDNPSLKRITLTGRFEGDRVVLTERELRGVVATVRLQDGSFLVEEGRFNAYGGSFRADGTEAEIWRGRMPFHLRFQGEGIEVSSLVAAETGRRSPVSGQARLSLDLSGVGIERADLEDHLSGAWSVALPNAKLSGLGLSQSVLGAFSTLPGFSASRLSREETLRDLFAGFEIRDGRMELEEPLVFNLDGSPMRLEGAVGIFGDLFLQGSVQLQSNRIAQLTGGRCRPGSDPVVPLRIGGKALAPELRPDASAALVELAKACLGDQVERAADRLLGEGTGAKAREAVEDLEKAATKEVERAKAAVDREVEEAKAAAEAEAARLKAEAERRRKAAEEEAKKQAKEAADKLRKRIGF